MKFLLDLGIKETTVDSLIKKYDEGVLDVLITESDNVEDVIDYLEFKDFTGNIDYKFSLELEDDAARVNWGGTWKMPGFGTFKELRDKCTWTLTTLNNTNVYKVTGPNGHYIYLPATTYWTSTLGSDEEDAYCLSASTVAEAERYLGYAIRPVCP